MSYAQAAAHLDVLARMHARWWDSAALDEDGELGDLKVWDPLPPGDEGAYQRGQLQPAVWSHLHVSAARRRRAEDDARPGSDGTCAAEAASLRSDQALCFLHGDYHLGNLYFDADGRVGTLDWQSFCKVLGRTMSL